MLKKLLFVLAVSVAILAAKTSVYHITQPQGMGFGEKEINNWYASYLIKHINKADEADADLIILELNTPGGLLNSTFDIQSAMLNSDTDIAVYINDNALSAGAFIALTAKYIYMAPGGTVGAAAPIIISNFLMKSASEKTVSAMRAKIRAAAEKHGRNGKIAEAMVDEKISLNKEEDGVNLSDGKLLTLTTKEALELGFINGEAMSVKEIINNLEIEDYEIIKGSLSTRERVFRFFGHPVLLTLLIIAGIVGVFVEIKTPGFGIGGSAAILAFTAFFLVQILGGDGNWIAPMIFGMGLLLLLIEMFVIPGFGVAGVLGFLGVSAGIVISFGINSIEQGLLILLIAVVLSVILIIIIARFLPDAPIFKKLSLNSSLDDKGYQVSESYSSLTGKKAKVEGTLRPAGIIITDDGERYDAVSEGTYIERGSEVEIVKVEGNRIVVRKV